MGANPPIKTPEELADTLTPEQFAAELRSVGLTAEEFALMSGYAVTYVEAILRGSAPMSKAFNARAHLIYKRLCCHLG